MNWIKRLLCNHRYIQSLSCKSERVGNHNYVYNYELYKCEECGHRITFKILDRVEKNYYLRDSQEQEKLLYTINGRKMFEFIGKCVLLLLAFILLTLVFYLVKVVIKELKSMIENQI